MTAFVILAMIVLYIICSLYIVPEGYIFVLTRGNKFCRLSTSGLHFRLLFIENIEGRVEIGEHDADIKDAIIITKDNFTVQIDAVVTYSIMDAKAYVCEGDGWETPEQAINHRIVDFMRKVIGDYRLEDLQDCKGDIVSKVEDYAVGAFVDYGLVIEDINILDMIVPDDVQAVLDRRRV